MKRATASLTSVLILWVSAFSGCETLDQVAGEAHAKRTSVSGEAATLDELVRNVEAKNIDDQKEAERRLRLDTVRAYNKETGRYEFVPKDSIQHWNEEHERWEFVPGPKDSDIPTPLRGR